MKYCIDDKEFDDIDHAMVNILNVSDTFDACIMWYRHRRFYSDRSIIDLLGIYLFKREDIFDFIRDTLKDIEEYMDRYDKDDEGVEGLRIKR